PRHLVGQVGRECDALARQEFPVVARVKHPYVYVGPAGLFRPAYLDDFTAVVFRDLADQFLRVPESLGAVFGRCRSACHPTTSRQRLGRYLYLTTAAGTVPRTQRGMSAGGVRIGSRRRGQRQPGGTG